jgi:bifunctional DNA-binding transcriptional regulator/antitoxin component of YhaV-PrlF toxin-antitoxin module
MKTLSVTARGQVTFRKKVLQHLGIKPGEKIELDLLPDGRGMIRAARRTGSVNDFIGLLAGKTRKVATIEEINEAAAEGWAGRVKMNDVKVGRVKAGRVRVGGAKVGKK